MFKFHRAPELTDASAGKNASPLSLSLSPLRSLVSVPLSG